MQRKNPEEKSEFKSEIPSETSAFQESKMLHENDAPSFTPLQLGCIGGHLDVVNFLLFNVGSEGGGLIPPVGVNDRSKSGGDTAAMLAAKLGHLEIFKILVKAGADLTIKNNAGLTAWDVASDSIKEFIKKNNNPQLLKLFSGKLILKDKDITPLQLACLDGDKERVVFLLKDEKDINHRTLCGNTAFLYAALIANLEILKILKEANADIGVKNKAGLDAMDAVQNIEKFLTENNKIFDTIHAVGFGPRKTNHQIHLLLKRQGFFENHPDLQKDSFRKAVEDSRADYREFVTTVCKR